MDDTPTYAPPESLANSDASSASRRKSSSCILLAVTLIGLLLLLSLIFPWWHMLSFQAKEMKAVSNARQIFSMLSHYAADHNGHYPDAIHPEITTSNQALRHLIIKGYALDERIFGSPVSKFVPDGNLGTSPNYEQALQPGENHWALVTGIQPATTPNKILLLEDPADPVWPPRWNADQAGKPIAGRPWSSGSLWGRHTIIIARNDRAVTLEKLTPGPGLQPISPEPIPSTSAPSPIPALDLTQPHRILDVED